MADITLNPAFMSMRGRLGGIVFYKRLNKQCSRIYVIPHNPDTAAQRKNRASFSGSVAAWKALSIRDKQLWNAKASALKKRGYNLFISEYMNGNINTSIVNDKPESDV